MRLNRWVACAALFWGFVVFMPVGMNYLAFFILLAGMILLPGRLERVRRLRVHPMFWPLMLYLGWMAITLLVQPTWYAETPSNLWHGVRIALTLALALVLSDEELMWAVRGLLVAASVALVLVALHHAVGLPAVAPWRQLVEYMGNKAISNAILMTLLAGSGVVMLLLPRIGRLRWLALAVVAAPLAVLVTTLPNRTSLLVAVLMLPLAALHQWRNHKRRLVLVLLASVVGAAAFSWGVKPVRERWEEGAADLRMALAGKVDTTSWNQRIQLIRGTVAMIRERPLMGWGVGAWNDQWRKRSPAELVDLNMPHNDVLWMGSQGGIPAALSWLAVMLSACWVGWRRTDVLGRLAFVAACTALLSALLNSATRDAVIGLSLLWVLGLYVRLAGVAKVELLPHRARGAATG